MTRLTLTIGVTAVFFHFSAFAAEAPIKDPSEDINSFLKRFDTDPASAMKEALLRWDDFGNVVPPDAPGERWFPELAMANGEAIKARDRLRSRFCMNFGTEKKCLGDEPGSRAAIRGSDLPEALTDNGASGLVRTLEEMEKLRLSHARTPKRPWSGDYWPYYKGSIAARYADAGVPFSFDFRVHRQYVFNYPAKTIVKYGSSWQIDHLSPAEKYDLLIGHGNRFRLAQSNWEEGEMFLREHGSVPTWFGICQGWSAGAMMESRPRRAVRVRSADTKIKLTFYPDDIKALASLLWAHGEYETRFAGGRCSDPNPATDANGRIISRDCFDTNPGTWHLALTNQVGISRRGLILDSSYDEQIWNQPILSYRYYYFNPQTFLYVNKLSKARVPIRKFTNDKFRSYRSKKAAFVVGIAMDVTYMIKSEPSHAISDSAGRDRLRRVRYMYDLELDRERNIIGGEWYTQKHPDFLWVPVQGTQAVSPYEEEAVGEWVKGEALPDAWRDAAQEAAIDGFPLAKIVNGLIQRSLRR